MVVSEIKLRLENTINSLIDVYFNGGNITEKFLNSTLKIIVKQNIHKFDEVFNFFADKEGEIDMEILASEYANMIPDEGVVFDLKEYVSNDFVKDMIPDKVLIIKKEDIMSLLN
jgi:hypothetical protein